MHNLDGFEKILKDKLEQQQYAYDPSQWNAIEKQLPPPKQGLPWKYIAAASAIVAGGLLVWQLTGNTEQLAENNLSEHPENTTLVDVTNVDDANTTAEDLLNPIKEDLIVVEDHAVIDSPPHNTDQKAESDVKDDADPLVNNNNQRKEDPKVEPKDQDLPISPTPKDPVITVERPSAQFTLTQTTICAGFPIEFNALNKIANTDYLWDFGNGEFSKKKSPTHSFDEAGTYYVSLEARSTIDNSVVSRSDKIAIVVNPLPDTEFSWEENNFDIIPSIQFINRTNGAVKWSWDLGNGKVSHEKDPIVTYKKKGFYNITLTATNLEGCSKVSQQEIEVATSYNLLAPNSFTPNADGINDEFIPEALKILDVSFEMTIYDQRGLVFQSRSLNDPWDGYNQRDGGKCPQGAYAWIVKYKDHEGIDQVYKGTINLLK